MSREMRFRSALTWPPSTRPSDGRTPPRAGRLPACEAASEPHLRARLRRRWVAVPTRLLRALTCGQPAACGWRRCAAECACRVGHVRAEDDLRVLRVLRALRGFLTYHPYPNFSRNPRLS